MLKPTALAKPCPKGPVVISIPSVWYNSGCPGVLECNCLKRFKSSKLKSKPHKCNKLYANALACPPLKTNLSLLSHLGLMGLRFRCKLKTTITSANPKHTPGCPLLALSIMSAHKKRSVFAMLFNRSKSALLNRIKFFHF